jgi:hypothetical protein
MTVKCRWLDFGSNRTYIEQTIPHISSLMKTSAESAVDGSEVVVVAKRSSEFEDTPGTSTTAMVVDLVSALSDTGAQKANMKLCW